MPDPASTMKVFPASAADTDRLAGMALVPERVSNDQNWITLKSRPVEASDLEKKLSHLQHQQETNDPFLKPVAGSPITPDLWPIDAQAYRATGLEWYESLRAAGGIPCRPFRNFKKGQDHPDWVEMHGAERVLYGLYSAEHHFWRKQYEYWSDFCQSRSRHLHLDPTDHSHLEGVDQVQLLKEYTEYLRRRLHWWLRCRPDSYDYNEAQEQWERISRQYEDIVAKREGRKPHWQPPERNGQPVYPRKIRPGIEPPMDIILVKDDFIDRPWCSDVRPPAGPEAEVVGQREGDNGGTTEAVQSIQDCGHWKEYEKPDTVTGTADLKTAGVSVRDF